MTIDVIGYNAYGEIIADIDGTRWTVPDDFTNRHRYMIWDEWEMGPPDPVTGERERINTIPPYVPPAPPEPEPEPEE